MDVAGASSKNMITESAKIKYGSRFRSCLSQTGAKSTTIFDLAVQRVFLRDSDYHVASQRAHMASKFLERGSGSGRGLTRSGMTIFPFLKF